ncbi:hypothetical protein K5M36_15370, partial [Chromobacterium vaccinii]|nr:hypothetical protein [Chromobacterium vaccinii]
MLVSLDAHPAPDAPGGRLRLHLRRVADDHPALFQPSDAMLRRRPPHAQLLRQPGDGDRRIDAQQPPPAIVPPDHHVSWAHPRT